jgi:membrane protein YdbS with pleckstrin-like domain
VLQTASEVRDRAQLILGAISLVIWLIVAFALGVVWYIDEDTPLPILMAGGIALIFAALPWLAYRPLVRRLGKKLKSADRRL